MEEDFSYSRDITGSIANELPVRDILTLCRVNRRMGETCRSIYFWRQLIEEKYPWAISPNSPFGKGLINWDDIQSLKEYLIDLETNSWKLVNFQTVEYPLLQPVITLTPGVGGGGGPLYVPTGMLPKTNEGQIWINRWDLDRDIARALSFGVDLTRRDYIISYFSSAGPGPIRNDSHYVTRPLVATIGGIMPILGTHSYTGDFFIVMPSGIEDRNPGIDDIFDDITKVKLYITRLSLR